MKCPNGHAFFDHVTHISQVEAGEMGLKLENLINDCFVNGQLNLTAFAYCDCTACAHGDLHPENVLVTAEGEPVVIDWEYACENTRLLDEFSWVWHPLLSLSLGERLDKLAHLQKTHHEACRFRALDVKLVIEKLLQAKLYA